jgi:hypothetical protein
MNCRIRSLEPDLTLQLTRFVILGVGLPHSQWEGCQERMDTNGGPGRRCGHSGQRPLLLSRVLYSESWPSAGLQVLVQLGGLGHKPVTEGCQAEAGTSGV